MILDSALLHNRKANPVSWWRLSWTPPRCLTDVSGSNRPAPLPTHANNKLFGSSSRFARIAANVVWKRESRQLWRNSGKTNTSRQRWTQQSWERSQCLSTSWFVFSPACVCSSRGVMLPPSGQRAEGNWRLTYVTGDLFSCPEDEALAHCISEDCRMGAGIAVRFRQKFDGVNELHEQSESFWI